MSTLKVDTIQGKTGDTVDLVNNNNISMFQLNGDYTTSSQTPVTMTGWSQMNSQAHWGYKQVGNLFTESSGFFSTTRLGLYRCYAEVHIQTNNASRWTQIEVRYTPNGGVNIGGDIYSAIPHLQSDTTYDMHTRMRYYNINHTGDKISLAVGSIANVTVRGAGSGNNFDTMLVLEWLAPPVA